MIKTVLISCWACVVVLASQYATGITLDNHVKKKDEPAVTRLETRKTKEINIPKIRGGVVKGYVVVQLNYVVDQAAAAKLNVSPDAFVSDELFKYIYADDTIDFDHLETYNLKALFATLIDSINKRLNAKVVTDLGVQEFSFMPNAETRKRP